jgi:hypothetical protein
LVPGYDSDLEIEEIKASDITHVDAKIVFFNACCSATNGSFSSSFGLNNEFYMGWNDSIKTYEGAWFALNWWVRMFFGANAADSATKIGDSRIVTYGDSKL